MNEIYWGLPILAVAVLIASGHTSSTWAGVTGLVTAISAGLVSAPHRFDLADAFNGVLHGVWLALFVGSVILGGLFFREILSGEATASDLTPTPVGRRRDLYAACFLVGPFAEAATGFGVGQVTIAPALKKTGVSPVDAVLLGLFSQMMIPWGAMANGTIVGSQLSGVTPRDLGLHSAILTLPLLLGWLGLFWRVAAISGHPGTIRDCTAELAGTLLAAALLIAANASLGREIGALAALGPLIAINFQCREHQGASQWANALRVGIPYAALVAGLAVPRAIPAAGRLLGGAIVIRPLADGPAWLPLLHPSTWLVVVGLAMALGHRRSARVSANARSAWARGWRPILTITLFLAMAQVMVASGMADGLATGIRTALGPGAVLIVPLSAGFFGFLTSSSSAANGLLMPAQVSLAQESYLSLPWLAAVQNVAAAAATMLSPVRVAVGCALVGRPDLERKVYGRAWPLAVMPLVLLMAISGLLLCRF